jgi:hypothetical protein
MVVSKKIYNMKHYTAENYKSSYQTHVTEVVKDMCDNRMVCFCNIFGRCGYLLFN